MSTDRRVAVVTGTRAEYGLLKSSMEAIDERPELTLQTVATGMHLSHRYGHTIDEIRADGFQITDTVHMLIEGNSGAAMAKGLGTGTAGLAESFERLQPDLTLVLGDRDEALAAGMAAAHMNIPVAHIHGGDAMEGAIIDDSIRHALTKFAHLHFPVSEQSAERLRKLGEEDWRISTVGAPGLDAVLGGEYTDPASAREKYGLSSKEPFALLIQHPITTAPEAASDQMRVTLDALAECGLRTFCLYPNSDAGSQGIIETITRYEDSNWLALTEHIPREDFLGLMAAADVVLGNSSSAIIEAPSLDTPVIDIGERQAGRERAANTISVPHDQESIQEALDRCLTDSEFQDRVEACDNPYNHGGAGQQIAARLATVDCNQRLLRKRLTY